MVVELWKPASDALCSKVFSLCSPLCWHWELLETIIEILPLACGTRHLYMGGKTAELGDYEVLNWGVTFAGNRIEEHCLAYDRKTAHKVTLMKYSWGIRLWFTAISILLFEVFPSSYLSSRSVGIWQCRCQSWWLPAVTRAQLSWTLWCLWPNAPSGFSSVCFFALLMFLFCFLLAFFCLDSWTYREFYLPCLELCGWYCLTLGLH